MTTRHITTLHEQDVCDVCGRTLLRGEQIEVFVSGSRRYSVCELCKHHALHEGWVREGTIPDFQGSSSGSIRRRSLLSRFRPRADDDGGLDELEEPQMPQTLDDELSIGEWPSQDPVASPAPARATRGSRRRDRGGRDRTRTSRGPVEAERTERPGSREPRHVHAVPTSGDHKVAVAVDVFNRSDHTRTVSGVARSLGSPYVNLTPDPARATVVWAVASWELCWYRYEIDLSDDPGVVRLDSQGYELTELAEHELVANASADEAGRLAI
jgi:hypothetical protein